MIESISTPCLTFRKIFFCLRRDVVSSSQEDRPLLAVRDWLFNTFAPTLRIWRQATYWVQTCHLNSFCGCRCCGVRLCGSS